LQAVDLVTTQGARPYFTFDAQQAKPDFVEAWAQRVELGARYSLLFGFIAKGFHIESPKFVQPGSHACLEIADVVSYVVARYIRSRLLGVTPDLDPAHFGEVNYSAFLPKGLLSVRSSSYPWEQFFGARRDEGPGGDA
jgi:hypothetical protein